MQRGPFLSHIYFVSTVDLHVKKNDSHRKINSLHYFVLFYLKLNNFILKNDQILLVAFAYGSLLIHVSNYI